MLNALLSSSQVALVSALRSRKRKVPGMNPGLVGFLLSAIAVDLILRSNPGQTPFMSVFFSIRHHNKKNAFFFYY